MLECSKLFERERVTKKEGGRNIDKSLVRDWEYACQREGGSVSVCASKSDKEVCVSGIVCSVRVWVYESVGVSECARE